jgi:alpha-ribazole phosphatase
MKNYRITLLRHGQTDANTEGLYIGKTDMQLSDLGRGELLTMQKEYHYPRVERVYTSPLSRAVESATILFPDIPIENVSVVDTLREMDFGVFEGLKASDLVELDSYKTWLRGGFDAAPPDGESAREVLTRTLSGLDQVICDMMERGVTDAALVTHAGIITNIICGFGLPKLTPAEAIADFGKGFMISVSAALWQGSQTFEIVGRVPA